MDSLFDNIKKSNLFRYSAGYLAFSFVILQLAEILFDPFGIDSTNIVYVLIVLTLIFPIVVIAGFVSDRKKQKIFFINDDKSQSSFNYRILKTISGVLLLLFIFYLSISNILLQNEMTTGELIETKIIPNIEELIDIGNYEEAFNVANEHGILDQNNEKYQKLIRRMIREENFESELTEIDVFRKSNNDLSNDWIFLGRTPISKIRVPRGHQRYMFVKEGFDTLINMGISKVNLLEDKKNNEDKIYIEGGEFTLNIPGLDHIPKIAIKSFLIDKYEVSNDEYYQFIKDGGYDNQELWPDKFLYNGKYLTFDDAKNLMIDQSGMLGPSTWVGGQYNEGMGDYPVAGISWYEASAYAKYRGRSLPTIYHWNLTASTYWAQAMLPYSNFSKISVNEIGENVGISRYGLHDMAGNVREWCSNTISLDKKVILGGGWNDDNYTFQDIFGQDPLDRSITNGLRLLDYINGEPNIQAIKEVELPQRDFLNEKIVSDEIYQTYLNNFKYDKIPPEPSILINDTTSYDLFDYQLVEYNAVYNNERMSAHIFVPKNYSLPYKPIVLFPGSGSLYRTDGTVIPKWVDSSTKLNFFLKQGYAFIWPTYKSTFERSDEVKSDYPNETVMYKKHVIYWVNDFSATIDYLETLDYIDSKNIVYFGISWGGFMANTILAIEKRIKTGILLVAGLCFQKSLPEVEAFQFTKRIDLPVLMLNGRYDHFFPYETSQIPMYELISTNHQDKKYVVVDDGHTVPDHLFIKESTKWLNKYLD